MNYKIHMLAFNGSNSNVLIREVELDILAQLRCKDFEDILNLIYHYGQNDIQPQSCYSVSLGDVIEIEPLPTDEAGGLMLGAFPCPVDWDAGLWLVIPVCFKKITVKEFTDYQRLSCQKRISFAYKISS